MQTLSCLPVPLAGNRLPRIGLDSPKIFLVPHGIDIETFSPGSGEEALNREKDARSILFLASVTERKGIFDLLEAFPLVLNVLPDARLSIVGPGDDIRAREGARAQHDLSRPNQLRGPRNSRRSGRYL